MKIIDALANIENIHYPEGSSPAVGAALSEFLRRLPDSTINVKAEKTISPEGNSFDIAILSSDQLKNAGIKKPLKPKEHFFYFLLRRNGAGSLVCSHAYYLYSAIHYLFDHLADQEVRTVNCGKWIVPAFKWNRISYDYFLTQQGRIQYKFNPGTYIGELARLGFTHVEVNGLAFPMGLETGPKGETYPMFYTYCPALDQFVYSKINKGLYPKTYLSANLEYLKRNARRAIEFGLVPGLLCFEPRSVPERFFQKYPMLRGARVDHPFRSFKPRYNMTITHPLVREHYAEMIRKLMEEIPELGFINIWTNDSGAGFEHTKSLYVGRNGGAYLIREWKDDEEIARLAGENAIRFFGVLRDAAREINPDFRVITRMESFYGEHDTVWNGLREGIEIETSSLIAIGWEMPYTHPRYPDSKAINAGTLYQMDFNKKETDLLMDLTERGSMAHFYFSAGQHSMFDPLMGIPYPSLTYQRIRILHENKIEYLAQTGGISPPELVPYNINQEIIRLFQYFPDVDLSKFLEKIAGRWAGEGFSETLQKAWKYTEEAIMAFPNVIPLYSTFGFTWYRLWARPFVPDIESIHEDQRAYYEDQMCTTPHNPNNVDLSRDVLFQLTTPEKSLQDVERIDSNVWPSIDKAISLLGKTRKDALKELGEHNVIEDQFIRLSALRCWFMTQRNVAAWVAGVYGYMNAKDTREQELAGKNIKEMIRKEIENSIALSELLDSDIEFMAMTEQGETPLIYGKNLKQLLEIRIKLMEDHMNDKPFIDHGYMERKAGERIH